MFKVGVAQFRPDLFKVKENLERAAGFADDFEGDLLVFPEFAFTGYLFNIKEEVAFVSKFTEDTFGVWKDFSARKACAVTFGFPEREGKAFYNSCAIVFPDGTHRVYRKTHVFSEEKRFFKPGNTGFFTVPFRGVNVGLAICFDWFFPESFRTLALMGADLIAHPSNLVMPYCQRSNVFSSLQNRVYIATANRWGTDENNGRTLEFTGKSQITSPNGEVIERADEEGDFIIESEIDTYLSRNKLLNNFNDVIADRRPEFYNL